jgi:PEP-CTERM motif
MSPINFRKIAVSLAIFAVVALGSSVIARADSISFDLNQPNAGLAGFPGPYATVTINRTSSTTATLTFTAYAGFLIGGAQAADVNFNGGPVTFSNLTFSGGCTGVGCPAGGTGFSAGGSTNADGFGVFNFTLDNTDGFTNAVSALSFDVSCPTCSWSTAAGVLSPNNLGNSLAAHIFVINSDCGGSPCTGFATVAVPEPASMFLLGTGLLGIAAGVRRRLRK